MENSWKLIVLVTGAASLTLRSLLDSEFGQGTVVYIIVPFAISILLAFFTRQSEKKFLGHRYLNHLRNSTIVFLATSAFLFEGFICVLMFMPIYYLFVSLGFLVLVFSGESLKHSKSNAKSVRLKMIGIPLVVAILALEGLVPETSFQREGKATFITQSPLSVAQLQANMARPINFQADRHWFMQLFPMPDAVDAGSLATGDIHKMHFTYKRWVFANVHKGEMHIKIAKVSPDHIKTTVVRNDSYLANYMRVRGTDIHFTPIPRGGTQIALTVSYHRLLDPAWYFGPMQQFAAKQSAKQFLRDIILRHEVREVVNGA